MRGDLIFYVAGPVWYERLIAHFTHGPYCHVEVDMGDGTAIGAYRNGVRQRPIPGDRLTVRFPLHASSPDRLADGLSFLTAEIGKSYGWADIFNQVLKILRSPIFLSEPGEYDCSDLVTRYVCLCGGPVFAALGDRAQEPHMVTPNDLARAAGLIRSEPVYGGITASAIE